MLVILNLGVKTSILHPQKTLKLPNFYFLNDTVPEYTINEIRLPYSRQTWTSAFYFQNYTLSLKSHIQVFCIMRWFSDHQEQIQGTLNGVLILELSTNKAVFATKIQRRLSKPPDLLRNFNPLSPRPFSRLQTSHNLP